MSDNFEWQYGRTYKEGLFQVDFSDPSFPRKETTSSQLFSKIAAARGIDRALWDAYALATYPPGIP